MDKIEKQTDSPKKTVSNSWTEHCLGTLTIAETVNDGAHLSMLDQSQSGGCENRRNHQTRRETSSHEQCVHRDEPLFQENIAPLKGHSTAFTHEVFMSSRRTTQPVKTAV